MNLKPCLICRGKPFRKRILRGTHIGHIIQCDDCGHNSFSWESWDNAINKWNGVEVEEVRNEQ